jgi:hypothetical protein
MILFIKRSGQHQGAFQNATKRDLGAAVAIDN